jgi:hypothetical protein
MLCLGKHSLILRAAGHSTLLRCYIQVLETIYEATSDELHVKGIAELSCRQL